MTGGAVLKISVNFSRFLSGFWSWPLSPVLKVYSVLVSVSCPKALFHLEIDNLFCITRLAGLKSISPQ